MLLGVTPDMVVGILEISLEQLFVFLDLQGKSLVEWCCVMKLYVTLLQKVLAVGLML